MKNTYLCENVEIKDNELFFASQKVSSLAEKYGTPLYLMDEDRIRERIRSFKNAVKNTFGEKGRVLYASKAASFKRIYEIMKEEEMGIDVVSSGEIFTAFKASFPLENAYFHSNNKTDEDISFAMEKGVGFFVADNKEELLSIEREAEKRGIKQNVLLRITPGIDPHTYAAVATGKVDSKFGSAIKTGAAEEILKFSLSLGSVNTVGFHCHVGSQVFDSEIFLLTAEVMLKFVADMKAKYNFNCQKLDLGGGFGVPYLTEQPTLNIGEVIAQTGFFIKEKVKELNIEMPEILFEPGRSIVADSGMTVYKVGSVKKIPEFRNYVSVDGGMTDNIRYCLYGSRYSFLTTTQLENIKQMKASVVGRCCESGDILGEDISLPENIKRGDYLAVLTTGAYNYSMSSNYNRIPRPPVVMLKDGENYVAVRRERVEDLTSLDE